MKKLQLLLVLSALTTAMSGQSAHRCSQALYHDSNAPVSARVADLLSRMTLEEKAGQLRCIFGWPCVELSAPSSRQSAKQADRWQISDSFRQQMRQAPIGMLWGTFRADPWTQRSLTEGLTPHTAATMANALQRYAVDSTRLGIPLLLAEEAPHGHMAIGTTVFPTGLGMAATFDTTLIRQVGERTAREIRAQGGHISYGPVLDLARDPRWSRIEETFGEDPVLTAAMGAAMVRGACRYTLPTLKHFVAYGTTLGGQNGASASIGRRDLTANYMPPFRAAIDAGAASVMTSYGAIDGIPSTTNPWLYNKVLRDDWNFHGTVVSDLYSINVVCNTLHAAPTLRTAAVMALRAGIDIDLGAQAYALLPEAVRRGEVSETLLDSACARVLRQKFEIGLFEHPYVRQTVHTQPDRILARRVAEESVTLLKNNGVLPLRRGQRIALVGPNADNAYNMLGDYTAPQPESAVVTVREGLESLGFEVDYVKGCAIRDTTMSDIAAAVCVARAADVTVAVVGGSSARDFRTSYEQTGAASAVQATVSDMESGEGFDRMTLDLLGDQLRLLQALKATGKPLVVVYIEGRPLNKNWADNQADALLTAYYPGMEGGTAVAGVLSGDVNPSGRLPMSVPRSVGQLPVYYNRPLPEAHDYVEGSARPLYPFGYGLSYTTFRIDSVNLSSAGTVSMKVTNSGQRDGAEVVQLYVRPEQTATVQPVKRLAQFCRLHLKAGETRSVRFTLTANDQSYVTPEGRWETSPGGITVMVGTSADDIVFTGKLHPAEKQQATYLPTPSNPSKQARASTSRL